MYNIDLMFVKATIPAKDNKKIVICRIDTD